MSFDSITGDLAVVVEAVRHFLSAAEDRAVTARNCSVEVGAASAADHRETAAAAASGGAGLAAPPMVAPIGCVCHPRLLRALPELAVKRRV